MNKIEQGIYDLDNKEVVVYNQKIYSQNGGLDIDLSPYKRILIHYAMYDAGTPTDTGGSSYIAMLDLANNPSYGWHKIHVLAPIISNSTVAPVSTQSTVAEFSVPSTKDKFYAYFWYQGLLPNSNHNYYVSKITGVK